MPVENNLLQIEEQSRAGSFLTEYSSNYSMIRKGINGSKTKQLHNKWLKEKFDI
jgi:hypothetical protein